MSRWPFAQLAVLLVLLATSACDDAAHFENLPLKTGQANPERRSVDPGEPDRPVILMTFSGGGSRAAALAAAVLRELAETSYVAADGSHPLTADVKFISSVSGGSVTAAWFGLNRDAAHEDGKLDELRDRFLAQDNTKELELEGANPITWFRLAFSDFTRIEALEKLLDQKLFLNAKMAALNQPGKPFIALNTTDMAGEESFALTPRRLDDICSSYDDLPISTGVAASAAFPILLSPVSFRDFSNGCAGQLRNAEWFTIALSNPFTPHLNLPTYRDARYTNDLRHGSNPFRDIDYLYFLDGGLADNLGVKSLRAAMIAPYDDVALLRAINEGKIQKLVIIVVNARSDPGSDVYQKDTVPGILSSINAVTSVPIDANTANSQLGLAALLDELSKAPVLVSALAKFQGMKVYGATVDFDQIPSDTPANRELRDKVKAVPTSWTLSEPQLALVESIGRMLLRDYPCYQLLIADLKAAQPMQPPPVEGLANACTTKIDLPAR